MAEMTSILSVIDAAFEGSDFIVTFADEKTPERGKPLVYACLANLERTPYDNLYLKAHVWICTRQGDGELELEQAVIRAVDLLSKRVYIGECQKVNLRNHMALKMTVHACADNAQPRIGKEYE